MSACGFKLLPFLLTALVFSGAGHAQTPESQQAPSLSETAPRNELALPSAPPIEFRQLHPEARRLIVEEIKLELQAAEQRRYDELFKQISSAVGIGSGVLAILGALLALVGWRGFAGLKTGLRNDVLEFVRTDARFDQELNSKLQGVASSAAALALDKGRREISFARLEFLARKVAEADGFTHAERDAMKTLLLSVKDDPEITGGPAFQTAAYQVLRSLYSADLDVHIDELEAEFRSIFVRIPQICGQLIDSYGERLLESEDVSREVSERFSIYSDAAKSLQSPPWATPYSLAFVFDRKAVGWEKRVDALFKELSFLPDESKEWLLGAIKARSERTADKIRTYRQERETELVGAFFKQYQSRIETVCAAS